jgi:pimeloyl-ACP methyl ester carboxylesterase
MATFVLVHGSWFGSWCWEKVVPLLEQQGHRVAAPDLPGYGQDQTPPREITLQHFADRVCRVLDAQAEPVVLVGHSRGGVVITQAAEYRPDKIQTLVYVCAFLPRNGESLLQLAQQDRETLIFPHLTFAEDRGYVAIKDEGSGAIKEVFCGQCSDLDLARATPRLVPDPLAPVVTPVHTTEANFGRIQRVYIECLRDRAIGPGLQRQMYTAVPCHQVISMDTDHSPFLSAPEELAAHLISVAPPSRVAVA